MTTSVSFVERRIINMLSLEDFKKSGFYEQGDHDEKIRYARSCILKDYYKEGRKCNLKGIKTYTDCYNYDIETMTEFVNQCWNNYEKNEEIKKMIYSFYIDPDGYDEKTESGVICSADGLLSFNRIYDHEKDFKDFIDTYKRYREIPIFFFPRERGGINTTRSRVFGDRIDHTLFDIKNYFEGREYKMDCLNKKGSFTHKFMEGFKGKEKFKGKKGFPAFVEWLGIKGIFTDKSCNVFDIEKDDDSILKEYSPSYEWNWSDNYYNNIKKKINLVIEKGRELV